MVDGLAIGSWSGNSTTWNTASFDIPAGIHTLTWIYEKDTNTSSGEDKAWIDNISITSSGSNVNEVLDSKEIKLSQNYPNPFNPNTMISFYNNNYGTVKLVVIDSKGQEVAEIVNKKLVKGNHFRKPC